MSRLVKKKNSDVTSEDGFPRNYVQSHLVFPSLRFSCEMSVYKTLPGTIHQLFLIQDEDFQPFQFREDSGARYFENTTYAANHTHKELCFGWWIIDPRDFS